MGARVPLIPPETIEQINAANDIVEVVGGYIPLKRAGAVWKALCPFHQERTPSFTVNPQRQIFKCFGCGAGGGPIRFVQSYENLDFVSAVRKLAERAGIKIVEAEMSAEDQARYGMRRRLLALHAEAAEFFHGQLLKKPSAQIARDYLKSRGIGGEIAKSWKLVCAGWVRRVRGLRAASSYDAEEIVRSGLVKAREENRDRQSAIRDPQPAILDRFRARVMFPICDDMGQVIAFSGRVLEADAKAAKYVNSPETMLFTKGAVLFGLHKSMRALIDKASAIVCEGQLDLITAFEAGVQNVVAPQGTAFTAQQAHRLRRYVEAVVLLRSDAAGEKAAERSLPHFWARICYGVATMPPGEDPDSLIRGKRRGCVQRADRGGAIFRVSDRAAGRRGWISTPRGKMQAARKLAGFVSLITDGLLRETVLNNAAPADLDQELVRMLHGASQSATWSCAGGDRADRRSGCWRLWRSTTPARVAAGEQWRRVVGAIRTRVCW